MTSQISKKILFWIIVLIIIPFTVTSFIVFHQGRNILREEIYNTLEVSTYRIESQLLAFLNNKKTRVHDFSSDGVLRISLQKINDRPQNSDVVRDLKEHLERHKLPVDPDILNVSVFDKEGKLIVSTNEAYMSLLGTKEHENVIPTRVGIQNAGKYLDSHSRGNDRQFTITAPVSDHHEDNLIGAISVSFTTSAINKILPYKASAIQKTQTTFNTLNTLGKIYLLDNHGTIIAANSPEFLESGANAMALGHIHSPDMETVREFTDASGIPQIDFHMHVKEPEWTIVVSLSKGDAFAPLDRLTFLTFFIVLTGIIVVVILSVLLTRRIARPVLEITETAARIAEGKLDERIAIKDQNDEISQLGCTFNYMVARLETSANELRKRETEIRESEFKYRTLLENLPQKIFLKDIHSAYIACNEQYARDLKIRLEEIKGKTDYDFFPAELAEKYRTDDQRIIRSGETEELEESYVVDEKEFLVRTIKTLVRDEGGNIQGILGIFWDITDEKLAEKERRELETQLRHMQKMEAISQLTSGIAHDFNNMLTAIMGNGYILQTKLGRESGLQSHIEDILCTAERAAHLTRRLLTFSRKQIIDIKPASLNGIIENVERLLLRIIGEDIALTAKLSGQETSVMADTGQIEQVLVNLVANARDAMPKGGALSISTEVVILDSSFMNIHAYGKPGKYALITVADTGTGMDEETEKRIFEPFFTTKEVGKGTGLGLSIVYGIVKQHQGYINVYSEVGQGSIFKIYLPLIETEAGAAEDETAAAPVPATGTETILLTEDEAQVRALTKRVLEDFGYEVIEAVDGEEAVFKFTMYNDKISLLILDVIMPKKNGKEAYHEMMKVQPGIKTIFTSGYNEEIIHKNGILDDGLNFISKPFVPTELLRKVREVLDSPVQQ